MVELTPTDYGSVGYHKGDEGKVDIICESLTSHAIKGFGSSLNVVNANGHAGVVAKIKFGEITM